MMVIIIQFQDILKSTLNIGIKKTGESPARELTGNQNGGEYVGQDGIVSSLYGKDYGDKDAK